MSPMDYSKERDREKLLKALDEFSRLMKNKLLKKLDQGFRGWDTMGPEFFERTLVSHIFDAVKGREESVDIANLALFLYFANRRERQRDGIVAPLGSKSGGK